MPTKKKKEFFLKQAFSGSFLGFIFVLGTISALAFTDPTGAPSIVQPADEDSTGQIQTIVGTPASTGTGTDSLFNYLRLIDTNIGGAPASTSASSSDDGTLVNLIGTNGALANGQTIFNYLKKINDNLDLPDVASVRSNDTVGGASGSIANCTDNNGGTCYVSEANKSSLDADLTAANIATGVTIFGVAGSLSDFSDCASEGEQDCKVASPSWYAGELKTVSIDSTYYGGGGGGGAYTGTGGAGGAGGGGAGISYNVASAGTDGTANTGGGGGGANGYAGGVAVAGGDGGSGVVIMRYLTASLSATGGTVTTNGAYTTHTFNSSGTFTPSGSGNIEVLVVGGGGGGGGYYMGGGGGGGGVIYKPSFAVTAQAYSVTVGAGGDGGSGSHVRGSNGSDSVFSTLTALGGGGGGSHSNSASGLSGGSGGGASGYSSTNGLGTIGQGNNGGDGASYGAGGGGGAGGAGSNGTSVNGGAGGVGLHFDMYSQVNSNYDAGYYAAFNLTTSDPNLKASNIADGITIFGVTGNRVDGGDPPGVPTGLSVTEATNGSLSLSWTPPASGVLSFYKIYRGTSSGSTSLIHTTSNTNSTYTDSTVSNSTVYYYQVSAANSNDESAKSSEASGKVQICYVDNDNDGYGVGGSASYHLDSCGSGYMADYDTSDCYDSNANAYPGSSYYGSSHRGDSSFDYNCDDSETQMASVPVAGVVSVQTSNMGSSSCVSTDPQKSPGFESSPTGCGFSANWRICDNLWNVNHCSSSGGGSQLNQSGPWYTGSCGFTPSEYYMENNNAGTAYVVCN